MDLNLENGVRTESMSDMGYRPGGAYDLRNSDDTHTHCFLTTQCDTLSSRSVGVLIWAMKVFAFGRWGEFEGEFCAKAITIAP